MHRGDELASRRENATRKCFLGAIASVLSITLVAVAVPLPADDAPRPDHRRVPGVVIAHSPAASGIYIGSPGIPRGPASPRPVIRTTMWPGISEAGDPHHVSPAPPRPDEMPHRPQMLAPSDHVPSPD